MIKLRQVTPENMYVVMGTMVKPDQREFVGSTTASIAEESMRPNLISNVIYNDDDIVGYVLHGTWDGRPMIFRILIDQNKQQKGYGTAAIKLILDLYKNIYGFEYLDLPVCEDNTVAVAWYQKLGFKKIERTHFDDPVYRFAF